MRKENLLHIFLTDIKLFISSVRIIKLIEQFLVFSQE